MIYTAQLISHKANVAKPKKVEFVDPSGTAEYGEPARNENKKNTVDPLKPSLKKTPSLEKPSVTQEHFLEAVEQTQPSVTPSEVRKYEQIYSRFQGGKVDNSAKQQKATL